MKSTKQVINDVIKKLSDNHKTLNSSPTDNDGFELSAFDLIPIEFTGMIEDYMFRQSGQILQILKEETDQDIEGLTYDEIKNDFIKNAYYDKVKMNIPKYYCLKPSDRQKHFKLEGQLYIQKLGVKTQQLDSDNEFQCSKKKSSHDLTPMKAKRISKKQTKNIKKQQKKNNCKNKEKPQSDQQEVLSINFQLTQKENFATPQKKQKQKKQVKFFQFQYVKDFSQHKTPKNLLGVKESIEPLRQEKPQEKQQ